jgi:hypothetical protein
MGGFLKAKLVKPTKVFSRPPDHAFLHQFLPSQAEADVGAAGAGVLGEADPTVGHELTGLDPLNRVFDQSAELLALFVGDGGSQVLDLNQSLAHEDDLGDVGDAGDSGVADQSEGREPADRRVLPDSGWKWFSTPTGTTFHPVSPEHRHRLRSRWSRNRSIELDLEAAAGLTDADTVVLGKAVKQ